MFQIIYTLLSTVKVWSASANRTVNQPFDDTVSDADAIKQGLYGARALRPKVGDQYMPTNDWVRECNAIAKSIGTRPPVYKKAVNGHLVVCTPDESTTVWMPMTNTGRVWSGSAK